MNYFAMSRKWIIIIASVVILLCLGSAFWLLNRQTEKQPVSLEAIGGVPFDAVFIVQFNQLSMIDATFRDTTAVWRHFITGEPALLQWLRQAEFKQANTTLSVHPLGKNELALLCCVALPPTVTEREWEEFIGRYGTPANRQNYYDSHIISLRFDNELIYLSYVKGLALASSSDILLQTAIRHCNSGESLAGNEQFAQVAGTIGANVDICLLINHRQLPRLLHYLGNKPAAASTAFLSLTANWTALDGQFGRNILQLNGFIFPSFTNDNFLTLLLNQQGGNTEAWEALPANTAMLLSFTLGNPELFLQDYAVYLGKQKELNSYKQAISALDKNWPKNAQQLFTALYPAEVGLACLPYNDKGEWLFLLKSSNSKYALQQLRELADYLQQPFTLLEEKTKDYSFTVYRNPATGLQEALFGKLFGGERDTYFTVTDDWFYFSNNSDLLKAMAQFSSKQSLKRYLYQTEAAQYLSNNAGVSLLLNAPQNAGDELSGILHPNVQGLYKNVAETFTRNITALQLRPSGDKYFVNFFSLFDIEPVAPEAAPTAGLTEAEDKNAGTKAGSERLRIEVINHNTKEKEFFVQFTDNSLGLLAKNGKLLWRKKFNEPITGTALQIDYLNNKKLQYLFCCGKKLYLYDRNGNIVKPFPITLKQPVEFIPGSATAVQKQPAAIKLTNKGKTNTFIYIKDGRVEVK